jgi:hypothetical protein
MNDKFLTVEYFNRQDVSGGLGDRIFGLISGLMIAKHLNRKLIIKHDYPNIKAFIDYDDFNNYQITGKTITIRAHYDDHSAPRIFPDPNFPENMKEYQNIIFNSNFNAGQYIYLNPTLVPDKSIYDKELKEFYDDLYVKYLRPKGLLKNKINFYETLFNDVRNREHKKIMGVHLRCCSALFGGENIIYPETDIDLLLPNILKFIKEKNFNPNEYTIYLLTDHEHLTNRFYHHFKEQEGYEIIYDKGNIIHLDKTNTTNGLDKTFLDQIMLSKTDLMIIPDSNFSRISRMINHKNQCYIYRSIHTHYKIINGEVKIEEFSYKDASSRYPLPF